MNLITGTPMKNKIILILTVISCLLLLNSCKDEETTTITDEIVVPVTVTSIDTTSIADFEEVSGTVSYIVKTPIKSIITGYITSVAVKPNDLIAKGKTLFTIKTKEALALGNDVNKLDPNLHFGKPVAIQSSSSGYVTAMNVEKDNYVQEGDVLAIINDLESYGVVINIPFELMKYVKLNSSLWVYLPDGSEINATVKQLIPSVDVSSQMQSVFLRLDSKENLPENLIVSVRIPKSQKSAMITLPKTAILSNEIETEYWTMKVINDSTAVKIPVEIGIRNQEKTEIISPKFDAKERFLTSGNFGVGDTLKVKIIKSIK
jgi:multidrug efflux pump subunit AcrA (membrane-fusion protein)